MMDIAAFEPDPREELDGPALTAEMAQVLPLNNKVLEYDLTAEIIKRLESIEFPLRTLLDPATAPLALLPFLAWERSIDLWDDTWTEEQKRKIILKWVYLHRIKGTKLGISEHVRYAGGSVKKVVAPPVNAFASKTYTQAERDAWLAVMPQFRLYRFKTNGYGPNKFFLHGSRLGQRGRGFLGRSGAGRDTWPYRAAMPLTDAANRIGTRAFLYDPQDGSLVACSTLSVQKQDETVSDVETFQVLRKGNGGRALFPGSKSSAMLGPTRNILGGVSTVGGVYTMSLDGSYNYTASSLHLSTVSTSLSPVDTRFEYVQELGVASPASCFPQKRDYRKNGMILHKRFLPESSARERLYQRIYLFDPTRGVTIRQARSFLGNMRLGIPAYTAEISILVTGKRLKQSANDFVHGFLHKSPTDKLDASLRAVRIAKAARDKTLVKIGLNKVPEIGKGLPLDTDYHFGDRLLEP